MQKIRFFKLKNIKMHIVYQPLSLLKPASIRTYGLSITVIGNKESYVSASNIRPVKFYFATYSTEGGGGGEKEAPTPHMPFFKVLERGSKIKTFDFPVTIFKKRISISSVVYSCKRLSISYSCLIRCSDFEFFSNFSRC